MNKFFLKLMGTALLLTTYQGCSKFEALDQLSEITHTSDLPDVVDNDGDPKDPVEDTEPMLPVNNGPQELDISKQLGVVGAWRFNNLMGIITPDLGPNNIQGQIVGDVTLGAGKFNQGLQFRANGHVNLGTSGALDFNHNNPATAYTISMWINTTSYGSLIGKRGDTVQYQMFVFLDGKLGAHVGGEEQFILSEAVVNNGQWKHVVMSVYSENQLPYVELFVDGQSVAKEVVRGDLVNNDPVWIGRRPGGFEYTGRIDEVVIFNRRLSISEIANLYK